MSQHFLLSASARTLSLASVLRMSDTDAETMYISLSRKIVESRARIPSSRLDILYGNSQIPTIIGPEEAVGLGLIDEIVELNPTGESQPDTVMWTVNWPP